MVTGNKNSSMRGVGLLVRLAAMALLLWASLAPAQTPSSPQATAPKQATLPQPTTAQPLEGAGPSLTCLPAEIRELVMRSGARKPIETCELACLQRPSGLDPDDLARWQRRHAIQWCRECIPLSSFLPTTAIERIEKEGRMTVCPHPVRPDREETQPGLMSPVLRGVRALFGNGQPAPYHSNLALIVSVTRGAEPVPAKTAARRDAETMAVLLLERLGYRHANVFEVRDARPADLDRLLGKGGNDKGLIAERLAADPSAQLLVYVSGAGAADDGADGDVFLLPVGRNEAVEDAGYPLDRFYQRLTEIKSASTSVVLEVAFRREPARVRNPFNMPETDIQTLPGPQRRGLVVMTSAEKDQVPLEDFETGLSLFTRHLVEGLAGEADRAPTGNGDGRIDTTEAFAFAAARTLIASRRVYGVLQRPMLSSAKPAIIPGAKGP